jgi:hypothetical protein
LTGIDAPAGGDTGKEVELMRATRAVAGLAGGVVLAGGLGFVALQQGNDPKAAPQVTTTVPAGFSLPTIKPDATPEEITQSVLDTLTQLQQQALPPGGTPQRLSEEQVIAALKAQQEQLGIKVP